MIRRLPVYALPRTRGDCIEGTDDTGSREERTAGVRQCEVIQCRHYLARVDSHDVPGRRHGGLAPPWTESGRGDASSPSCSLDVVDANPAGLSSGEVAAVMGVSRRRVEQIVRAWLVSQGAADVLEVAGDR